MILVSSNSPVTLVGGGSVTGGQLAEAIEIGPVVVAADCGVNRAIALGRPVDHVIGDMDSADLTGIGGPQLHPIAEQMTTDLDKCLYSVDAPLFLGVGFLGGRLDHQLASCHSLLRAFDKPVILIGEEDICFLAPLDLTMDLPLGTRISLFPMGDVTGRSEGLKWPIHAYKFSPAAMISISNEVDAQPVQLSFDTRRMLVILPATHLNEAVRVLHK